MRRTVNRWRYCGEGGYRGADSVGRVKDSIHPSNNPSWPPAGGFSPRCFHPGGLSARPRAVRAIRPSCSRYGSTTSSMVSRGSRKPRRQRLDAHRPAAINIGDHRQIAPVHRIETQMIDLQPVERAIGDFGGDGGFARNIGEIAHPAQQPSGDARRAARALGNLLGSIGGYAQIKQTCGAGDDEFQLIMGVEIQPHRNAKTVAERRGQQPLPAWSRRPSVKAGKSIRTTARRRPLADHDIQRTIFHGGIKDFLDHRIEPVDFVDEQNIAVLEIGEQCRQIAGFCDDRARGGAEPDAHFLRHNLRQRGFAQSRRAKKQHMIERIPARFRGLDKHAQIFPRGLLADEFGQAFWGEGRRQRLRACDGE